MTEQKESQSGTGCPDCAVNGRRDFLFDALRAGAVALAAIGIAPTGAEAMPLRWIAALATHRSEKSYAIPAADGVQIDKDAEVILSRAGKQVYAFTLSCPHQNTALRWEAGEKIFQCPKHKSRYRPDGVFIEGRATRSMDRLAIKLTASAVVVDVDRVFQEDLNKAEWTQSFVTLP
ncbi:MAG: Rieske (2Fe-2S) protein [bacterium]